MTAGDSTTTIQLHQNTRRLLYALKASGQSYEDLILEMAEDHHPPELLGELKSRFSVLPGKTSSEVFARARL